MVSVSVIDTATDRAFVAVARETGTAQVIITSTLASPSRQLVSPLQRPVLPLPF